MRRQVFVRFYSPGTFVDEETERPIERADIKMACKMASKIKERYGATPYGFSFITRIVGEPIDDGEGGKIEVTPKEVGRSGVHFIDGRALTIDDVADKDSTLARNMRGNGWVCCETTNSYRHTGLFDADDVIVSSATGEVIDRGDAPKYVAARRP